MSNILSTNPIVLDSANTSTVLIPRLLWVTLVVWNSGTNGVAGDSVVLKDKNANVFLDISISASKDSRVITFATPVPLDGLIAHTIANGIVYLYYKDRRNG